MRLSRAGRAGKDSCRVLDQRGAMRESWGATMGSVRVRKQGGRLSGAGEPEKTHAESYSQGEPRRSLSEPQAAQYESGKGRKTHLSLVSQKGLSRV